VVQHDALFQKVWERRLLFLLPSPKVFI